MSAEAVVMTHVVALNMLHSVSAANTAAATTTGVDLSGFEGVVQVTVDVGALTGTLTLQVDDSADNSAFTTIAPAIVQVIDNGTLGTYTTGMSAVTAHTYQFIFDSRSVRKFVRFLGTIGTGPSLLAVNLIGPKKYRP